MTERSQYQREVIADEQQLAAAHLDLDLQTIDHLLHADYAILQPGGRIEGKQETLASLREGERSWQMAQSDQLELRITGQNGRRDRPLAGQRDQPGPALRLRHPFSIHLGQGRRPLVKYRLQRHASPI